MLRLENLWAGWDQTTVLEAVSFALEEGACLSVIGRNGVGKTTLMETIMGHTRVTKGTLMLDGRDLTRAPPHRRAPAGVGYVPQEREIFASLSVEENLTLMARPGAWTLARVYELFPRLAERRRSGGQQLSGGEQQMLAIARALMVNPRLLLLDEPSEGLAPRIVDELFEMLGRLRGEGMAMVLVEQKTMLALDFAPRCLVLNRGRVVFDGASAELQADAEKLHALVGVG